MPELVNDEAHRLPGDDLIPDAAKQITRSLTIRAPVAMVWPELMTMVHDRLESGTSVLESEAPRAVVIGGLYDHRLTSYLPFDGPRPAHFWQATWALVLSPIDGLHTRLEVRARVAFTPDAVEWTAVWTHPFSDFTRHEDLEGLKRRVEALATR
jgi:hypothetical protein